MGCVGEKRTPPVSSSLLAGGEISACMGWMVQGMSGVWFHPQPSSEGPQLLSTLLPMARSTRSWQAGHQEHSVPPRTWRACRCQTPLGMPGGHSCVTSLAQTTSLSASAQVTAWDRNSHWDGKHHCLDAILYIKNLLLRSPGRDESVTEMYLAPAIITTPGQTSEAPGDPAPPWGTTSSPCPWPLLPTELGDSQRWRVLGGCPYL